MQPPSIRSTDTALAGLAGRIASGRKRAALTQAELAKAVGVSQSRVAEWEAGAVPEAYTVARVAFTLGMTTDELLFGLPDDPSGAPEALHGAADALTVLTQTLGRISLEVADAYRLVNVMASDIPPIEINLLGHRIRNARLKLGLSEGEVARAMGERTAKTVRQFEYGIVRAQQCDATRRQRMATALQTTVEALFAELPAAAPPKPPAGGSR